ncbi:MAG: patatin-like phospholipase family protein [Chloroflexi bacterium]|nr:patatin-like phospholipase family protein [Chloroflexota bacterium]
MKPLRKYVALAVDGGGIRGLITARALALVEAELGVPAGSLFQLLAGTSTGAIIAAALAAGMTADRVTELYLQLGADIFKPTLRSRLWPLTRYRYPLAPLYQALVENIGSATLREHNAQPNAPVLLVPVFDLVENRTRLVKSYKPEYAAWPLAQAALASCAVPTYFPVAGGRYVDGGVGSFANPVYLAAYETFFCQGWNPSETTLISIGTGRSPLPAKTPRFDRYYAWQWVEPIEGAFLQSAADQQVHLVQTFFGELDFRRFQVDMTEPVALDDARNLPALEDYGIALGRKILNDELDLAQWSPRRVLPRYPSQYPPRPLELGIGLLGAYLVARTVEPGKPGEPAPTPGEPDA